MKKTILTIACSAFMFAGVSQAQSNDAPAVVRTAFAAQYANVQVEDWDWEEDAGLYEGEFDMNGREYEAYFTPDGQWIKTKSELKKDQVPGKISQAAVSGEFLNGKAEDFYEMETPEGIHYSAKVKSGGMDYYLKLDENGNVIEKKTEDEKKRDKKMHKNQPMQQNQQQRNQQLDQSQPTQQQNKQMNKQDNRY